MNFEEIDLTAIGLAVIVAIGGVWKYLTAKHELQHQIKVKELEASDDLQDSLMDRIKNISQENKDLHKKVENMQERLMAVSVELGASKEKIKYLEDEVKLYELRKKVETMGRL